MTVRELLANMYYEQEIKIFNLNDTLCFIGTNAQTRSARCKTLLDKEVASFGSNRGGENNNVWIEIKVKYYGY